MMALIVINMCIDITLFILAGCKDYATTIVEALFFHPFINEAQGWFLSNYSIAFLPGVFLSVSFADDQESKGRVTKLYLTTSQLHDSQSRPFDSHHSSSSRSFNNSQLKRGEIDYKYHREVCV